jgi:hypothetical protein
MDPSSDTRREGAGLDRKEPVTDTIVPRPNYAAKHPDGRYWCTHGTGWVRCRYCAIHMCRRDAHKIAHSVGGTVVRIVKRKEKEA